MPFSLLQCRTAIPDVNARCYLPTSPADGEGSADESPIPSLVFRDRWDRIPIADLYILEWLTPGRVAVQRSPPH